MDKVLVIMSTYNGEKYLKEQVDSIMNQQNVYVKLLIRDDGSTDNSLDVLTFLQDKHTNLSLKKGNNIGFVNSFNKLVEMAVNEEFFEYYAFVDQDDIWYENKLQKAINQIKIYDKTKPCLFCSNSDIIDGVGEKKGKFFLEIDPILNKSSILIDNLTQGCSMVFNRKALELYASAPPQKTYHDRWMLLICMFFGYVVYDRNPLFAYRVHSKNTLGVKKEYYGIQKIKKCIEYWTEKKTSFFLVSAKEFYERFNDSLIEDDRILLFSYVNYSTSIKCKFNLMFNREFNFLVPSIINKIKVIFHILLNRL